MDASTGAAERAHFGADRDVGRPGWALGATLGSEISPGIVPRLPQPVLRAQSPSLARSTAQCDAVSPSAQASARQDQAEVSVAPRAAVAQCAVTSPRCVRRSLRRMAACSRRRALPVAIPGPVVAAVLRIAKKQCVGPLRVENTWIFERRLSICIKTNLS